MRVKIWIVILIVVCAALVVEVYYLKTLPCSFVRVYSTSDPKEFNTPPTEAMTVEIDGYVFDYTIPHRITQNNFKEIKDLLPHNSSESIDSLLTVANWVRSKLKFGKLDCSGGKFLVEEIISNPRHKTLTVLCDSYARLFVITCQSLGIPARILELEGHIVPEAFIRKIGKWVMIDPTNGYYMAKDGDPLSVVGIINSYKKSIPLHPIVFAESEGDDCLYKTEDELTLKKIYLNGFTVVSDQNIDGKKIRDEILETLQLPIAKMQFIDTNSLLIGYKEKMLRYAVVITFIIFVITSIGALSKGH